MNKNRENKISKFLKHPIISKIIGGLILSGIIAIIPIIWGVIAGINYIAVLTIIGKFLISIFTFKIPIWIIIILLILFIFIIKLKHEINKIRSRLPIFCDYKSDLINGILFKWEYNYNKLTNKYEIINITPLCKKCECILVEFQCPDNNCNERYNSYGMNEIESVIIRNIRNKFFKVAIKIEK